MDTNAPVTEGTYLRERIKEKEREIAKSNFEAELIAIWPEVVKELLEKFPNLSPTQKVNLRAGVRDRVQSLSKRTGIDQDKFTQALQEVASLLGRKKEPRCNGKGLRD